MEPSALARVARDVNELEISRADWGRQRVEYTVNSDIPHPFCGLDRSSIGNGHLLQPVRSTDPVRSDRHNLVPATDPASGTATCSTQFGRPIQHPVTPPAPPRSVDRSSIGYGHLLDPVRSTDPVRSDRQQLVPATDPASGTATCSSQFGRPIQRDLHRRRVPATDPAPGHGITLGARAPTLPHPTPPQSAKTTFSRLAGAISGVVSERADGAPRPGPAGKLPLGARGRSRPVTGALEVQGAPMERA